MKSIKKKLLGLLFVFILLSYSYATEVKTVLKNMDDFGIEIICVNGKIKAISKYDNNKFNAEFINNCSNIIPNENVSILNEEYFQLVIDENSSRTLNNQVTEIDIPYSSETGTDLTNSCLFVKKGNLAVYIKPVFEFYIYDKDHMGTSSNTDERQYAVYEAIKNDLKSTDKTTKEKAEKVYGQLNTILAQSIANATIEEKNISDLLRKSNDFSQEKDYKIYNPGNIEENANEYLKKYLQEGPFEHEAPVYSSDLYLYKNDRYTNYRKVTPKEGELLAKSTKRYLNWAVEYRVDNTYHTQELYDKVDSKWEKDNMAQQNNYYSDTFPKTEDESGNPVPYVQGGIDTPRMFWWKMHLQQEYGLLSNIKKYRYDSSTYLPGVGKNKEIDNEVLLKYAGCDALGMLSGIIEMSGLNRKVINIKGEQPATKLTEEYTLIKGANLLKERAGNSKMDIDVYSKYRFTIPDIEKITTIIPGIYKLGTKSNTIAKEFLLQKGDLLVRISNGDVDIAVISEIDDDTTKPVKERVKVIHIEKGYSDGYTKEVKWNELKDKGSGKDISNEYTPRRLLVKKDTTDQITKNTEDADWDIMKKSIDETKSIVTVGKKYEQSTSSLNRKEAWRFIPNTGEYLILDEVTVTVKNDKGVALNQIYPDQYKVKLDTAYDRSYNDTGAADTTKGNIYRNKAKEFSCIILSNGIIQKNTECRLKVIETNNVPTEKYKASSGNTEYWLKINIYGDLYNNYIDKNGNRTGIGIRPISASQAFPGDDLILAFTVYDGNTEFKQEIKFNEKDYIAVYDKKMLWRANLYIDEGADDWNNIHPWDTANNTIDWYGTNEWNIPESSNKGIAGGQVLSIPSTKWYYGNAEEITSGNIRTYNKSAYEKVVNHALCYDYQGWDSPFSYKEKLRVQKELLSKWYDANGNRFGKSIDDWDQECTTAAKYKEFLGDKVYESIVGENITDENITNEQKNKLKDMYDKYKTVDVLRWSKGLEEISYNKYVFENNYGKKQSPYKSGDLTEPKFFQNVAKANSGEASYIPGLSNAIMYSGSDYPSNAISSYTGGVDCIGFVQRSAAYGTNETTIYSALKNESYFFDPPTWGNNTVPAKTATSSPSARDNFHGNSWAVRITDINSPDDTETIIENNQPVTINYYKSFKYAVPGDIVWYDGHIMMISQIKELSGKNGMYKMEDVSILESVYNNGFEDGSYKIYGVGNKRDLDVLKRKNKIWEIWRQK